MWWCSSTLESFINEHIKKVDLNILKAIEYLTILMIYANNGLHKIKINNLQDTQQKWNINQILFSICMSIVNLYLKYNWILRSSANTRTGSDMFSLLLLQQSLQNISYSAWRMFSKNKLIFLLNKLTSFCWLTYWAYNWKRLFRLRQWSYRTFRLTSFSHRL